MEILSDIIYFVNSVLDFHPHKKDIDKWINNQKSEFVSSTRGAAIDDYFNLDRKDEEPQMMPKYPASILIMKYLRDFNLSISSKQMKQLVDGLVLDSCMKGDVRSLMTLTRINIKDNKTEGILLNEADI
jgi:hypothetical protein